MIHVQYGYQYGCQVHIQLAPLKILHILTHVLIKAPLAGIEPSHLLQVTV